MKKQLFVILGLLLSLVGLSHAQESNCVNQITVWDNDSLFSIAQANNISVVELAAKNGLATNARLRIGDVLCIDGLVAAQPAAVPAQNTTTPTTGGSLPPASGGIGTGGATTPPTTGGSLPPASGSIGTGGATTTPNSTPNFRRGQAETALPNGVILYNVAGGDTLFTIAGRNSVDVNDIIRLNNITNVNIIYLGETLLIPKTEANATPPPVTEGTGTLPPPTVGTGGATSPSTSAVHRPAAGTIPSLTLPQTAQLGGTLSVSGTNYPGNTLVNLYVERPSASLRSNVISQVTTASDGTFTASITLPSTWSDGQAIRESVVSISGYAAVGGYWAMNTVVISGAAPAPIGGGTSSTIGTGGAITPSTTPPVVGTIPVITLPTQAKAGDTITVTGASYPPNATVTLYIERPSLGLKSAALGEVTTDAKGQFSTTLTIPTTWGNGTPVNQDIVSVSGYSANGFWGMNYFVNR